MSEQENAKTYLEEINDTQALMQYARTTSESVSEEHQTTIFYYTVARYMSAVFEANNYKTPVQVWNEYRNCLDHRMRAIISNGDEAKKGKQLRAAEKHLLRACLDVIKLSFNKTDDWYRDLKKSKLFHAYHLIDNGNYVKDLEDQHVQARKLMINAKTYDSSLSFSNHTDLEVLEIYLDAFFAYKKLEQLERSKRKFSATSNFLLKVIFMKANWKTFLFSFGGKLVGAILIFLAGKNSDAIVNTVNYLILELSK